MAGLWERHTPPSWSNVVVVDVGAHIGGFRQAVRKVTARSVHYYGFEANAKNYPFLLRNVGRFAFHAAIDQARATDQYAFYDSILPNGTATGASKLRVNGSRWVIDDHTVEPQPADQIPVLDMGTVLDEIVRDDIDILKLDCEGAEFRILEGPSVWLDRVSVIVGEYHDRDRWERFVANHRRLAFWDYHEVSRREDKPIGVFHLVNPNRVVTP